MVKLNLETQLALIEFSYQHYLKQTLPLTPNKSFIKAFDECPYPIASHTSETVPKFNYANKAALDLFDVTWDALIGSPSRMSAPEANQIERETLLSQVKSHGFIRQYKGIRQTHGGKKFLIEDATVWNIIDHIGKIHGQAVIILRHNTHE